MLYIFGGLPGVGKSTLAKHLSRELSAVYIRIDTIEQSLKNSGLPQIYDEGYKVAFEMAQDNLKNGISVVADSTNPVSESRQGWINAAHKASSNYMEIEVLCSDLNEHRSRIESRTTDIAGLQLPDWQSVVQREYEPCESADIRIDTAGSTPEQSQILLLQAVSRH